MSLGSTCTVQSNCALRSRAWIARRGRVARTVGRLQVDLLPVEHAAGVVDFLDGELGAVEDRRRQAFDRPGEAAKEAHLDIGGKRRRAGDERRAGDRRH